MIYRREHPQDLRFLLFAFGVASGSEATREIEVPAWFTNSFLDLPSYPFHYITYSLLHRFESAQVDLLDPDQLTCASPGVFARERAHPAPAVAGASLDQIAA